LAIDEEFRTRAAFACIILAACQAVDGPDALDDVALTKVSMMLNTLCTEDQKQRIHARVLSVPRDNMHFWAHQAMILAEELPLDMLTTMASAVMTEGEIGIA